MDELDIQTINDYLGIIGEEDEDGLHLLKLHTEDVRYLKRLVQADLDWLQQEKYEKRYGMGGE